MPPRKHPQKHTPRISAVPPPTVSGSWLLKSLGLSFVGAVLCAWGTLWLLFWQGSWQLLYHPAATVARTPAAVGVAFEQIGFAATETGKLQLQGWWIPAAASAPLSRYTVLYLHGQNGNLGDAVDALAALHAAGVNIFAIDYRGFGQSEFARPRESRWREDAAWALQYLEGTRHIAPGTIVLDGSGLGANLAVEVAAQHSELAGVIADRPEENPMQAIFGDARASPVPAHLLVRDRFDLNAAAAALRIPSLWILSSANQPVAYQKVSAQKTFVRLTPSHDSATDSADAAARWLADLPTR
jgi:uncharacterized protein